MSDDREQLKDVVNELGIKVESSLLAMGATDEHSWEHDKWSCTLSYAGRFMVVPTYRTGTGLREEKRLDYGTVRVKKVLSPPEAHDVIGSMLFSLSACEQSFKSWASDFGYNTDSLKALNTYLACQDEADNLTRFTGDGRILERLRNAEY